VLEVLQLLRDQSYSMRDPREITSQLDGLVSSAEETERGVRDMEEIRRPSTTCCFPEAPGEELEDELRAMSTPSAQTSAERSTRARCASSLPRASASPPPPRKKLVQ
jgi:hypothetical protein